VNRSPCESETILGLLHRLAHDEPSPNCLDELGESKVALDGKIVEHNVEAGDVNLNAGSTHVVENLGDTPFEGLSIEPKTHREK
jgi:hypothetical protein